MAPPEISVTKSRTDCDLTQQMVGGIKASSPGMMSMSADMFLDLPTMSAPSGEERRTGASAQVERAGRCCRRPDSGTHTWCGRATVMVLVSSSSGPRVGGCPGARRYFRPYPVSHLPQNVSPREFSIVPRYPSGVLRRIGRLVIYYPHAIVCFLYLAPRVDPVVEYF